MTIQALVAITDTTYGGVYYTSEFTTSGAQPIWTRLTTTGLPSLTPDIFRVDYGNPVNIQYLGFGVAGHDDPPADGSIYGRNGGNWSLIMDKTIASTVTGVAITAVCWLWTDPSNPNRVYTIASKVNSIIDCNNYVLKSTDYGANWVVQGTVYNWQKFWKYLNVIGDYIWGGDRS